MSVPRPRRAARSKEIAMDERRRQIRYPTVFQAELTDLGTDRVIGHLADVSTGGMMIRTAAALKRGQDLKLRVELPARQADGVEARVEVKVRWCEPDLEPGTHVAGLAFTGATPPDGALVQELVRVLKDAS
jgi:Tfp pilus assembly protein PilZ